MSYYGNKGYRIEETATRNEEEEDFDVGFQVNFKNVDKPIVGDDGPLSSREEAEEFAEKVKKEKPWFAKSYVDTESSEGDME